MHNSKSCNILLLTTLVEPDTTCNLVCKSYVTTIHLCKWYVMIHICNFDIEALFKTYVIHMPHLYILKGKAMLWDRFLSPKIKIVST